MYKNVLFYLEKERTKERLLSQRSCLAGSLLHERNNNDLLLNRMLWEPISARKIQNNRWKVRHDKDGSHGKSRFCLTKSKLWKNVILLQMKIWKSKL